MLEPPVLVFPEVTLLVALPDDWLLLAFPDDWLALPFPLDWPIPALPEAPPALALLDPAADAESASAPPLDWLALEEIAIPPSPTSVELQPAQLVQAMTNNHPFERFCMNTPLPYKDAPGMRVDSNVTIT